MSKIEWLARVGTKPDVAFSPVLSIRFWTYTNPRIGDAQCWPWLGACYPTGYGQFRAGRRKVKAHRYAWALAHGGWWPGEALCVMHACDNPACVNPCHLSLGTHGENTQDRHRKGRDARGSGHGTRTIPGSILRGERNRGGGNKLNAADVQFIRRCVASAAEMSAAFGVSRSMICQIRRNEVWRHV